MKKAKEIKIASTIENQKSKKDKENFKLFGLASIILFLKPQSSNAATQTLNNSNLVSGYLTSSSIDASFSFATVEIKNALNDLKRVTSPENLVVFQCLENYILSQKFTIDQQLLEQSKTKVDLVNLMRTSFKPEGVPLLKKPEVVTSSFWMISNVSSWIQKFFVTWLGLALFLIGKSLIQRYQEENAKEKKKQSLLNKLYEMISDTSVFMVANSKPHNEQVLNQVLDLMPEVVQYKNESYRDFLHRKLLETLKYLRNHPELWALLFALLLFGKVGLKFLLGKANIEIWKWFLRKSIEKVKGIWNGETIEIPSFLPNFEFNPKFEPKKKRKIKCILTEEDVVKYAEYLMGLGDKYSLNPIDEDNLEEFLKDLERRVHRMNEKNGCLPFFYNLDDFL
jgi:hypothetical protein